MAEICVGIDLGTTYSSIGLVGPEGLTLVPNVEGLALTPSAVQVRDDEVLAVGAEALRALRIDPDSVLRFFKRDMGTETGYWCGAHRWSPVELSAALLQSLRSDAERFLGETVRAAVITVPAYFEDDARRATIEAAAAAGITVRHLLHEPTAAALAYGVSAKGREATAVVYDLGGGTFDVSIVQLNGTSMTVVATAGNHRLGGKDWDDALMDLVADACVQQAGLNPLDDPSTLADLRERAEAAKRTLSVLDSAVVTLAVGGHLRQVRVSRVDFLARTAHLIDRSEQLLMQVLEDGRARQAVVDSAILAGGATRMPACAEVLRRVTGLEPLAGVDPDQAVARGAALYASGRSGAATAITEHSTRDGGRSSLMPVVPELHDVTAHALGFIVIAADGHKYLNQVMIPRNAPIPATAMRPESLTNRNAKTKELDVFVLQGEAPRPLDNSPLGRWTFSIPNEDSSRKMTVEVQFGYANDGTVTISASTGGKRLPDPRIDRADRDISWSDGDPSEEEIRELSVALVIDCSGSMSGGRLDEAKRACDDFVTELFSLVRCPVGVVAFATSARVIEAPTTDDHKLHAAVDRLSSAGSTNMAAGLDQAAGALAQSAPGTRRVIVLLTDGAPDNRAVTVQAAERCKQSGVEIWPKGVQGADADFLRGLASFEGDVMTTLTDLRGVFRGIARQLATTHSGLVAK